MNVNWRSLLSSLGKSLSGLSGMMLTLRVVVVIVCTALLIDRTVACVMEYLKFETTAILSVLMTGEATYIAFTVCPAYEAAYKQAVLNKYGTNRTTYASGNYITPANISADPRAVYDQASYNLPEIVSNITLMTSSSGANSSIVVPLNNSNPDIGIWRTKYHNLYGKCYSLQLSKPVAQLMLTSVNFVGIINFYVFLHLPGQYLDFNSMTKIYAPQLSSVQVDVNYELTINTLGMGSELPCEEAMDSAFDDCLETKMEAKLMAEVGCSLPYVAPSNNTVPICDPNNATLFNMAYNLQHFLISSGQLNLCNRPCISVDVYTGLLFSSNLTSTQSATMSTFPNASSMTLNLKSTTKENQLVENYTLLSMIAEVGGYTGLLLGVSFFDLTRLVNLLMPKMAVCCKNNVVQ